VRGLYFRFITKILEERLDHLSPVHKPHLSTEPATPFSEQEHSSARIRK
jgi:hypothetical protein